MVSPFRVDDLSFVVNIQTREASNGSPFRVNDLPFVVNTQTREASNGVPFH